MSDGERGRDADDQWVAGGTADGLGDPYAVGDIDEIERDERPPMTWHGLPAGQRWSWFDRLWSEVCVLRDRYRLAIRSEWWADELQVEVLAAFAAWVQRYDSGEWDDPPGKLALLFDLERVAAALRDGVEPFDPERDRPAFEHHLRMLGCRPPTADRPGAISAIAGESPPASENPQPPPVAGAAGRAQSCTR